MTKRSKADWAAQMVSLLPDNTSGEISPSDIRSTLTDLFDSVEFPSVTFKTDSDLAADTVVAPSLQVGDNVFCLNNGEFRVYVKSSVQPPGNYITGSDGAFYEEVFALQAATVAEWQSKVAGRLIDSSVVWDAMAETPLSISGSTISLDLSTGYDFTVTLTGNATLSFPTNVTVGQRGRIRVVQDATGNRVLSFATGYVFASGSAPSVATAAGAVSLLYYDVLSSSEVFINGVMDVQ